MVRMGKLSRRDFLASSTRGAAAVGFGAVLAGRAVAQERKIGANDRITLGVIGSGGQGTHDAHMCIRAGNVVCAALCDVADFRLDRTSDVLGKAMGDQGHQGVKIDRYTDYRALLDRKDIDAVIIATPDHWHKPPFIAACEAGKHIYQEKPFSFTIQQGYEMLAAAQKKPDLCIQIGTQRRSEQHYAELKEFIDAGKIGEVTYVRCFDCRNFVINPDPFAPQEVGGRIDWDKFQEPCEHKVPYDKWRYFAWRWFWDYAGGLVTDVGVHVIDNVHWLLGEPIPKSAVCNGGVYALKYWETPDVVNAVVDYGKFTLEFTGNFTNGFEGDGYYLYGTKGTVEVHGNDVKVFAEGDRGKPILEPKRNRMEHQHNWIQNLRAGKKPSAPVELGVSSLLPSHLANMAYRSGRKVTWNDQTRTATVA